MRAAREDETPSLRRIWQEAFGDNDAAVDAFFKSWAGHGLAIAADSSGELVSAGYLLPAGDFLGKACAMIYAVATLTEYRGRGLAAGVTRRLIEEAQKLGYAAVIVCPAEDGLFDYYSRMAVLRDGFYVREYSVTRDKIPRGAGSITTLTASEYMALREEFLRDIPHVAHDLHVWEYQSVLCSMSGGGFCRIDLPHTHGCAVIEREGAETVLLKELLVARKDEDAALSAVAEKFYAQKYTVRTPVLSADDSTGTRRFGMLYAAAELPNITGTAYFGMAFD